MGEVKTFRVKGEMKLKLRLRPFVKEIRALNEKEALEKAFYEIGSQNKRKRRQIKIISVEAVKPTEIRDLALRLISGVGGK